jgi:hypothetical protein
MQNKTALLVVTILLCSTPLFAARPLITDNPFTQGKGNAQIEIGVELLRERQLIDNTPFTFKWTTSTASMVINYGLSRDIDLIADIPFTWYTYKFNRNLIYQEASAISDIDVQLKWRIYNQEGSRWSIALKPGITLPSGNENKNLGTGKVCESLSIIAGHTCKNYMTYVNLGYTHNAYRLPAVAATSNSNIWMASMATEFNLIGNLWLSGDIGIETSQIKNAVSNSSYILGSTTFVLDNRTDMNFGIKKPLNKSDLDASITYLGGVTLYF